MNEYFLVIEDYESQYNQMVNIFQEIDGYTNVVDNYQIINNFIKVLEVNQPKEQLDLVNDILNTILNEVDGNLTLLCDLHLYGAKSETLKIKQGIDLIRDLILPQIVIRFPNNNVRIILCTQYPEESVEPHFERLRQSYIAETNISFEYIEKELELSELHEDFIEDLKKTLQL